MKNYTKNIFLSITLGLVCGTQLSQAEYLYSNYILPSFAGSPNTEYSAWDVFYSPNSFINYPDFAAPNGTFNSASSAGFTAPVNAAPSDPFAFWHLANPTITQTIANRAFIIGPGTPNAGNIYSFSGVTDFRLDDTTPYGSGTGTVVFQFQSDGTLVDFDSIRLVYNNGSADVSLPANEYVREYRNAASSFGGSGNRCALQWNLTGLGITTYRIVWKSEGSSMSLQNVKLDSAATYSSEVPEARTWLTGGSQGWDTATNWQQGTSSQPNGNVTFLNASAVTVSSSLPKTIGELNFNSVHPVTLNPSSTFTVNTGINTSPLATSSYTINSDYHLGAFNYFSIEGGSVILNGAVTGSYGFIKVGGGNLTFKSNNSFGATSGGVGLAGGTLRMEGSNQYIGSTTVLLGDLVLAAPAPAASPGALGNATSNVNLGASSTTFAGITTPARLIVDGDHTIARGIAVAAGVFDKRIGCQGALGSGARLTGSVLLQSTSTDLHFFATAATDAVTFSGLISGGATANTLEINAEGASGKVIFTGPNKTYSNKTFVRGGRFEVAGGTSLNSQVVLEPDTTNRATLTGSGTINAAVVVNAGGVVAPGSLIGNLAGSSQTWNSGGRLEAEIQDSDLGAGTGWDSLVFTDKLTFAATVANPFVIDVVSLTTSGGVGPVGDFSSALSYSWKLVGTVNGVIGFNPAACLIDSSRFSHDLNGGSFNLIVLNDGRDLYLEFTASSRPLNLWLNANFSNAELADSSISGMTSDFDRDGQNTLLEYAFGNNPKTANLAPSVVGSLVETGLPIGRRLSLSFTRLLDRTDLNYLVQVGHSPADMTLPIARVIAASPPTASNGGTISVGQISGNTQTIVASDFMTVPDAPRRFISVKIEKP